ncbi:hypothetical protein HPB50_022270 [Hyalomma asiaticum]|uniref:Uncharacterized protein n=1 Tax=Hyalomma asiaticum TaxID=266040 RepID=A0ACB7T699_HYAAI|nr:hypothetical protein HPB50_022270 [Hyalomma asiaticum]
MQAGFAPRQPRLSTQSLASPKRELEREQGKSRPWSRSAPRMRTSVRSMREGVSRDTRICAPLRFPHFFPVLPPCFPDAADVVKQRGFGGGVAPATNTPSLAVIELG